jgi:hypothetical protein
MNPYQIKLLLQLKWFAFLTLFLMTAPALAQNESFGVSKVFVNNQSAKMMEAIGLTDRELIKGKIVIQGVSDASEVDYSIDAGKSWSKVPVENEMFTIEYDPGDNSRDYTLLLKSTTGTRNFAIVIRFQNRKYLDQFYELFNEMRDYWIDERLHEFVPYFAEDEYDNFTQLKENLEDTFDQNGNLNIRVMIATVYVEGDIALVRVDWERRWDDISFQRGSNNIIRFKRINGAWKITDMEDEAIFSIGTGTFRGNVSDRN